jgi:hypothetical protein
MFKAVYRSQHTYYTKDANGNAKQGKKSTKLVRPQFLKGHFKTAGYYFYGASNHNTNLPEDVGVQKDIICMVTSYSNTDRLLLRTCSVILSFLGKERIITIHRSVRC